MITPAIEQLWIPRQRQRPTKASSCRGAPGDLKTPLAEAAHLRLRPVMAARLGRAGLLGVSAVQYGHLLGLRKQVHDGSDGVWSHGHSGGDSVSWEAQLE